MLTVRFSKKKLLVFSSLPFFFLRTPPTFVEDLHLLSQVNLLYHIYVFVSSNNQIFLGKSKKIARKSPAATYFPTNAVSLAQESLTSVFGMGTGITSPLWPPGIINKRETDEHNKSTQVKRIFIRKR